MSKLCTLNPQPLKQQQHPHRLRSAAAPLQHLRNLTQTRWHFVHVFAAWLPAHPIYPPSLDACWSNAIQLAHMCSSFDREKKDLCVSKVHSYTVSQSKGSQDAHYCAKNCEATFNLFLLASVRPSAGCRLLSFFLFSKRFCKDDLKTLVAVSVLVLLRCSFFFIYR